MTQSSQNQFSTVSPSSGLNIYAQPSVIEPVNQRSERDEADKLHLGPLKFHSRLAIRSDRSKRFPVVLKENRAVINPWSISGQSSQRS